MATDPLAWIDEEMAQLRAAGLLATIRRIESPMDARVRIEGRTLLNFCANNYLGLANHARLRLAAKGAIDRYGVGPGAVRTIAGTMSLHLELEQRLAAFKHAEACITFQSGFMANVATIPALVGLLDDLGDELLHRRLPVEPRPGGALRPCRCRRSRTQNCRDGGRAPPLDRDRRRL